MKPHAPLASTLAHAAAAVFAAGLMTACGGGGGDAATALTTENAQGYASDAATMPVNATSAVDGAISTLETALGTSAGAASSRAMPMSSQAAATGSVACPNGGTVSWSVTGATQSELLNGQFDTGEVYSVTYTHCGTADGGGMLDGAVTLTVNSRTASSIDLTHATSNLTLTTLAGQWALNGSMNAQRSATSTAQGGLDVSSKLTSTGVSFNSTIGLRQASYTLNSLSWTVVRSYNASGALIARSHDGTLSMAASTPRRPDATLQITTQGNLALDSDGVAAQGSFSVVTSQNTIACTYGNGTATLTLDVGNDGTIDRTWTLTRLVFIGLAG